MRNRNQASAAYKTSMALKRRTANAPKHAPTNSHALTNVLEKYMVYSMKITPPKRRMTPANLNQLKGSTVEPSQPNCAASRDKQKRIREGERKEEIFGKRIEMMRR
jgi:hypothetical protein